MENDLEMRDKYTHSFHPYPAKFPANVIRTYIEKYSQQGNNIIDPFCGSGTTLVECRLLNRHCLGIDINPVSTLISKSKSAIYSKNEVNIINSIIEEFTRSLVSPTKWINKNYSDCLPKYANRTYWFKEHVIEELNSIKSYINQYKNDEKVYNLLNTAFSKIIVPISNQDSETRYARVEKDIQVGDAIKLFLKTIKSYHKVLANTNLKSEFSVKVIEGDTLVELPKIDDNTYDLALTSPPYINSFDYYLYHKHRIFLLNKNPRLVRKTEIGGHHTIDSQSYDKAFNQYYSAMKETFSNLHRILKPEKKFVLFIGDGIVKGKVIKTDNVMNDISKITGFKLFKSTSVPLVNVSRGFIKTRKIKKKMHHVMVFNNYK